MTVKEAGRKGGERTAQTHSREFYQEIGRKGGEAVASEKGHEFYKEIGRKAVKGSRREGSRVLSRNWTQRR